MTTEPKPYVIVAAVDVEGDSPGVLSHAIELARGHERAELHVLGVVVPSTVLATSPLMGVAVPPVDLSGDAVKDRLATLRAFAMAQIAEATKLHTAPDGSSLRVQVHALVGAPADEIVWMAAHLDADLVVVGTHGRRGLRRLLLGSVAERVARLAGCPVVVIRDKNHVAPWRVPEIEPVCDDCAAMRKATEGRQLWCARHSEHHVRVHVPYQGGHGAAGPSAIGSVTGT